MSKHPNVILVITDDQGYGDLCCTGNPWINTPNIDRFHNVSYRLTDFHVSPLCTPTRGAIMTGKRPVRNGAWATCWGRSILRKSEITMAEMFASCGYRTGMFGKWHLGDNYPYRPIDRGFQTVVAHKGGGVGQTPDFWGNNYFDDTYFHNGKAVDHSGYCTDIWFSEALKFIDDHRQEPFFAYIATNAPHSPYLVAEKYRKPYAGNPDIPEPAFYGMITNIDENFGRLCTTLQELGIEEDTILIFMTDNGSSGGCNVDENEYAVQGYNAGMRGKKGSYYDGGHRVPFFIRWPQAGIDGGKDIGELSLHIDLLPTFIDLCSLDEPHHLNFDGKSLEPILSGNQPRLPAERVHFLQYRQNTNPPEQWTSAVMTRRWRLIRGAELYDISVDPGQKMDVAAHHPEIAERLRRAHEQWWKEIFPGLTEYCPIHLGNDAENPTRLNAMDVMGDVAWHQTHIVEAQRSTGKWAVYVEREGVYTFTLRRWPEEMDLPIDSGVPPEEARRHIYATDSGTCSIISPDKAQLKIFDLEEILPAAAGKRSVEFKLNLTRTGATQLEAWFIDEDGTRWGSYYVIVERR